MTVFSSVSVSFNGICCFYIEQSDREWVIECVMNEKQVSKAICKVLQSRDKCFEFTLSVDINFEYRWEILNIFHRLNYMSKAICKVLQSWKTVVTNVLSSPFP